MPTGILSPPSQGKRIRPKSSLRISTRPRSRTIRYGPILWSANISHSVQRTRNILLADTSLVMSEEVHYYS